MSSHDPKHLSDLPRLTDEERDALDSGHVAIEGVPAGEAPAHTKGRWEAEFRSDRPSEPGYWVVIGEVMRDCFGPVADTLNRHHCISPEEDEANARVLAAAPELLKRAKIMLAAFGGNVPDWLRAEFAALESAIAIAEGQQS